MKKTSMILIIDIVILLVLVLHTTEVKKNDRELLESENRIHRYNLEARTTDGNYNRSISFMGLENIFKK